MNNIIKKILKEILNETKQDFKNVFIIKSETIQEYKNRFEKKEYILTQTELKFYRILKGITDELKLKICPQVSLYEIINAKKFNDFYRISNKTIDFVITEQNLKIRCCIELDDYTHKQQNRIKRDIFINEIFEETGIKLIRIPVSQYYNTEKIKNAITGS